ncbi:MAG TPA: hypothetical protein VFX18_03295 [Candidatus Nitrosocosmicus sp.]|nr:hypothetical protein [Candidatus Nitrosocosmicus sp.]
MAKKLGDRHLSESEKEMIISLIADYEIFQVPQLQMIRLIEERIKRTIGRSTLNELLKIVRARRGESFQWIDEFARSKMADFYRRRMEEMEYIQKELLLIFHEEASKPTHKNKWLMNNIAKTINDNSKTLADFGMSPPVVARIFELLPVDINQLNERLKEQKTKSLMLLDPNIDIKEIESTENAELERIKQLRKEAKDILGFDTDQGEDKPAHGGNNSDTDDPNRVF